MDEQSINLTINNTEWNQLSAAQIFAPAARVRLPDGPPLPIATAALQESYGRADILPIEFFKLHATALQSLLAEPVARSFLSSGTTRAERSQSFFSQVGLDCYRRFSIKAFHAVLSHFFADHQHVSGISLIPPVAIWPDSSLAQMVEWISQKQPVHYHQEGEKLNPTQPVWLFATAFHLVNLADDGEKMILPAGSVVIETGGTKGRSRSVTREELYALIEEYLGVPRNRIISEYGMCELASQAYDFVEQADGPEQSLSQRWFRFPIWAQTNLRNRLSQEELAGEGTLLINDRLRIDLPWPIRTEDMALVRADGAFQLLGRVPFAPLKGCSMLAEQLLIEPSTADRPALNASPAPKFPESGIEQRALILHERVQSIIDDPNWIAEWHREFASVPVVDWLRQDLRESLPSHVPGWCLAAKQAIEVESPRRWLIIPPGSHSFACLKPILIAAVAGLEVTLRANPGDTFVKLLQALLAPLGSLTIWPQKYRIGADPLPPVDALMVFGSDDTLARITTLSQLPIQGYGTYLSASIVDHLLLEQTAESIKKDAFSLMQRGCMASRLLFILNAKSSQDSVDQVTASLLGTAPDPVGPLPLGLDLALEHECLHARMRGPVVRKRQHPGEPLLTLQRFDPLASLAELLEPAALGLSIITVTSSQLSLLSSWLNRQQDLKQLAIGPLERSMLRVKPRFHLVLPGKANVDIWNGLHEARPLFGKGKSRPFLAP